jgi:hypothetical protein
MTRTNIQMVCWLIKEQNVRVLQRHPCKNEAAALPIGEVTNPDGATHKDENE